VDHSRDLGHAVEESLNPAGQLRSPLDESFVQMFEKDYDVS
jgi:hypothetical protein